MIRHACLIIFIATITLLSCTDDDGVNPVEEQSFLLRILVNDSDGDPVPDARVSAWNHIPGIWPLSSKMGESAEPQAVTSFRIDTPVDGRAHIDFENVIGDPVDSMRFDTVLAGTHTFAWAPPVSCNNGVYVIHLRIHDLDSGSLLFHDSILAVLYNPDASLAVIGYTSADGVLEIRDSLLFPNLFDLPPLIHKNASDVTLGEFSYSDTIAIYAWDSITGGSSSMSYRLESGVNSVSLTLPSARAVEPGCTPEETSAPSPELRKLFDSRIPPPDEFKLYQNYPNPFN